MGRKGRWEERGWESGEGNGNGSVEEGEREGGTGEGKEIVSLRLAHPVSKSYNRYCTPV